MAESLLSGLCLLYTYRSEQVCQAGFLYDQQGELCHGQSMVEGLNGRHGLVKPASQTTQCHDGIHLEKQTEYKKTHTHITHGLIVKRVL